MPTINKISFSNARTARFRSTPQQNMSMPKQDLKQDKINFTGFFSRLSILFKPLPELFPPELCQEMAKFIEKHPKDYAGRLIKAVLEMSSNKLAGHSLHEALEDAAVKVEKENIKPVKSLLDKIIASIDPENIDRDCVTTDLKFWKHVLGMGDDAYFKLMKKVRSIGNGKIVNEDGSVITF